MVWLKTMKVARWLYVTWDDDADGFRKHRRYGFTSKHSLKRSARSVGRFR